MTVVVTDLSGDEFPFSIVSRRNKKSGRSLIPVASVVSLAACGGGGSPSPSSPPPPPPPPPPQNAAPTDITVSAQTIAENTSGAIVIGTVVTVDSDDTSHSYTVSDSRFEVVAGELRLKTGNSLNYETILGSGSSATVTMDITARDDSDNEYTKAISITVTDVNDAPTAISLDNASVSENVAAAVIGTLMTTDEDAGDTISYTVSDGRFEIVGGQLKLKAGVALDYEVTTSIIIDVMASDAGGLSFTQQFTITVEDVAEFAGFTITGVEVGDQSGYSVSYAGDVNGDGVDDIIIGAPGVGSVDFTNAGAGYVIFGTTSGFGSVLDLAALNGSNGFALLAYPEDYFTGWSVSAAGDFNGDGVDDILIGAPNGPGYFFASPAGESYLVFGRDTGFAASITVESLDGVNGVNIGGQEDQDAFGASVSAAGDINGDGIDDIIIGAYLADPGGNAAAGESYVIFGSDAGFGAFYDPSILDGSDGFVISGVTAGDASGISVSELGDVNGDGIDDIIIGALNADPGGIISAGVSYVVFGSAGGFSANIDLGALDGSNGFAINGIEEGDESGFSVSAAGDVNGDGLNDMIIGEIGEAANSNESYVVFGTNGGFSSSIDLGSLDGNNGFTLHGINAGDRSGYSVSGAGDVNGDGFSDVIVGAPNADSAKGEVYIVFGSDQPFSADFEMSSIDGSNGFTLRGIEDGDTNGYVVSAAGDVNGDGFDDIIIGAPFADPGGQDLAGESYVLFGSSSDWLALYDLAWIGKSVFSGTSAADSYDATDGADIFDFNMGWGDDSLSGFADGVDLLDLSDTGLVFADLAISQTGADTLIEDVGGNSIILLGLLSTDISADDFIF